jgi:hypothetical protein
MYQTISAAIDRKYLAICSRLGVSDCTEARVFVAVTVAVALFYILYISFRLCCLVVASASTLMAIVNH